MRKAMGGLLLALLLATACAGPRTQGASEQPTDAPAATTTVLEPAFSAAATETRAPRTALEATDPATVSLAAGEPQLLEFFAFW